MADIFQEVDEDLRRDKAAVWWKRYGRYVIGAAVAVVVVVAGYKGWQAYDEKLRGERSDAYAEALALIDSGDEARAREALAALSDPAADGYPLLAALTQARLAAEAGDEAAAEQIWQSLASGGSSGAVMSQLGSLLAVLRSMDDGDPAVLRGELLSLAGPEAPYRFTALELLAVLALREGDETAAREHLIQITDDPAAPSGSRSRAAELLASLPG